MRVNFVKGQTMEAKKTICDFGLYEGEKYTDLPASFLNWMIETKHDKCELAKEELSRRTDAAYNNRGITKL